MKVYIFGNGNITYTDFAVLYISHIDTLLEKDKSIEFIICDFRGTDTLAMEYLKSKSPNVTILHMGSHPRYIPDKYRTKVSQWKIIGGFESDQERDHYAIEACSHYLAVDFNSNEKRKSGTLKNIERCQSLGKRSIDQINKE